MPFEKLASAYLYYDAAADDSRLCVAIARTAAQHGAAIANQCRVTKIVHNEQGIACGAQVQPTGGDPFTIRATTVVNAAGVWADDVRQADEGTNPHSIRPAKGIHITVPWNKVRNDIAIVIPVRKDKRSLFVVPWIPNGDGTFQYTYVGTTDTDFAGGVNESQTSAEDIHYVLEALNQSITTKLTVDDVTAVWSGLRPLVSNEDGSAATGKTADLSRKHKVKVSPSGVISIMGGKLTTYRKMSEHTVDEVVKHTGNARKCKTKSLSFIGAAGFKPSLLKGPDAHLAQRFGSEMNMIKDLIAENPTFGRPLIDGLPYLRAEAVFACRHEMAQTLDDVLSRRTRARIINRRATLASARSVAELMAGELNWDSAEIDRQISEFIDSCSREEAAGMVSEAEFLASQ